ncbi:MAG: ABC transporter ATP-binding protein [Candidatus Nanoarchaeia archaeon]
MAQQTPTNMIEGIKLCKTFKDFWGRPKVNALKDVDIVVESGTVFGLLGPNGAGKSTLLKLILGHLYPTSGIINVLGKSPRDVETKSRIGYMSERPAFYPTLTANETLLFFAKLLGLPIYEAKKRISQLLKMVGIENAANRHVGEFSYGMKKRLALAQALINDPDLLLLDEPTAGLDPIGCREVKDLMLTLGKRGKTIVMTSHLLADVQDVCNKIMIIYGGQVQAEGPVNKLLEKKGEIIIRSSPQGPETISQIEQIIKSKSPDSIFEVQTPTRSLEEYFLSVIAEANRSGKKSTGAQAGGGIAEYLSLEQSGSPAEFAIQSAPAASVSSETREISKELISKAETDYTELKSEGIKKCDIEGEGAEILLEKRKAVFEKEEQKEVEIEKEEEIDNELLNSLTRKK